MADVRWYHGRNNRQHAEDLLMRAGKDGSFIVRESETIRGAYALSVLHQGRIHTYRVLPTKNGQLGVQTKDGIQGRTFTTISQLVNSYRSPQNGLVCGLSNPVGPASSPNGQMPIIPTCPTITAIAGPPLPKRNFPGSQQVTAISTSVLPLTQSLHSPPPLPPARQPQQARVPAVVNGNDVTKTEESSSVRSMVVKLQNTGLLKFPFASKQDDQNIKHVGETAVPKGTTNDSGEHLCVICMDSSVNTFFAPCGHVCCCFDCAGTIKNCPLCRKTIEARHKAYLS